jgi:putative FmdB family regulatory protein
MPVYTYKCKKCSELVDKFHGFDDEMKDKCSCGGKLAKMLQLSGVTFKGNGFYRTDSQTNRPKEK